MRLEGIEGAPDGGDRVDAPLSERGASERTEIERIHHEVRTPLHIILGSAEMIADREATTEERIALADSILRSGEQLARLADRLLACAEVEAGDPSRALVADHRETFACLTQAAAACAARHGRGVDLELAVDDVSLDVAPDLLRRLADELVDNALRYSPAGSKVKIACQRWGHEVWIEVANDVAAEPPNAAGDDGALQLGLRLVHGIARCCGATFLLDRENFGRASAHFIIPHPRA